MTLARTPTSGEPAWPDADVISVAVYSPVRLVSEAISRALASGLRVHVLDSLESTDRIGEPTRAARDVIVIADASAPAPSLALKGLARRLQGSRLVLFGLPLNARDLRPFAELGAQGLLGHDATEEDLFRAVADVASGGSFVSTSVSPALTESLSNTGRASARFTLTERERQVAALLATGKSYAEIGRAVGLSSYTVKNHAHNIYAKCNVSGRDELTKHLKEA